MPVNTITQRLLRPDDLLHLVIEMVNLRLEAPPANGPVVDGVANGPAFLVVDDPEQPALIRIQFPPQHITEFAAFESDPLAAPGKKLAPDTSGVSPAARTGVEQAIKDSPDRNDTAASSLKPAPLPPPGSQEFMGLIAGGSRLVFRVPAGYRLPYTVEGLLDWQALEPVLHPIAAIGEKPTAAERAEAPAISAPDRDQTALELPFRLLISPDARATWQHRARPFGGRGRFELWHTRLVQPVDGGIRELDADHPAALRALWSSDYRPDAIPSSRNRSGTGPLARTALSEDDRHQLVILTSAFRGYETDLLVNLPGPGPGLTLTLGDLVKIGVAPYVPKPFHASQLMLSALGGWLRSRGSWTPPRTATPTGPGRLVDLLSRETFRDLLAIRDRPDRGLPADPALARLIIPPRFGRPPRPPSIERQQLDLSEWVHQATLGRDHYVRVVYDGELWPFRHRASLVKVTERRFIQPTNAGGRVIACLVQRVFIVVRQPEVTLAGQPAIPLKRVRLTTLVTPNLAEPCVPPGFLRSFWVEVGPDGSRWPFRFHAVGTDQAGRPVDFDLPLVFASIADIDDGKGAGNARLASFYNGTLTPAGACGAPVDRHADFQGHQLAYTPLATSNNPLLATEKVWFQADAGRSSPSLLRASVRIPALADLLGADAPIQIAYDDSGPASYVKAGGYSAANGIGVFAKIVDGTGKPAGLPLSFRADQAGGFATPNQAIVALSRDQGPVAGDIATAMADSFDPAVVFPPAARPGLALPLLFGTFGLDQLLDQQQPLSAQAPRITTRREGLAVVTELVWMPILRSPVSVGVASFVNVGAEKLAINGAISTSPNPGQSLSEFTGQLGAFDIELLSSVKIHFQSFFFRRRNGAKPEITVRLDPAMPLEFTGDLRFVEELRKAIPPGLFGDGASLEVLATGLKAGFALALPPLEIGVFALKDVSLGAALTLPFLDGKPILDFNVSERANPFQLRVAFFAGGGFFHLQMDTAGMRQLEIALEFGAAFSLSIAVATGEVHAMAGIYFGITRDDGPTPPVTSCTLAGFLRLGGRLAVLGLIRVSVEFNLTFKYQTSTDKAYGRATLTVMVEVLFLSTSVELTVERAFGGSADPVFQQTFPSPPVWHDYASAFA